MSIILLSGLVLAGCNSHEGEQPNATASVVSMSAQRADTAPPPVLVSKRFGRHRAAYTLASVGSVLTVTELDTGVGVGIDSGIQRLQFADGTLALDIDGVGGTVYRVYQAAFDRKPDTGGYAFWLGAADSGVAVETIAAQFIDSEEFRKLYGAAPSNVDLLTRIYQNVLHRAPDQAGFNFWLNALNNKIVTPSALLAQFSDSAENKAQVLGSIQSGIWVPAPAKLSASLADGPVASVGKVVAVNLSGVALTDTAIRLGATPVPSRLIGGQLVFAVPETMPGDYQLSVSAGGQSLALPISIKSTVLPASARAYVEAQLVAQRDRLATVLANAAPSDQALLSVVKRDLDALFARLPSIDDAELKDTALLMAANFPNTPLLNGNGQVTSGPVRRAYTVAQCEALIGQYFNVVKGAGAASAYIVVAAIFRNSSAVEFGRTQLSLYMGTLAGYLDTISEECSVPDEINLMIDEMGSPSAVSFRGRSSALVVAGTGSFDFVHKRSRTYSLVEKLRLVDVAANALEDAATTMAFALGKVQQLMVGTGIDLQPYIERLARFSRTQTRPGKAGDYALGGISDSRISGSAGTNGDKTVLSFAFKEGSVPKDKVGFSFDLTHIATKRKLKTVSATLTPLPSASIDSIFAVKGKVVAVEIPPMIEMNYPCSVGNGICKAGLFCKPDDDLGATLDANMRFTLDADKGIATIYFPDGSLVGSFSVQSGAINAEVSYDDGVVMEGNGHKFFGGGSTKLSASIDATTHNMTGTILTKSFTSWTLSSAVAMCSATTEFTAVEATKLN